MVSVGQEFRQGLSGWFWILIFRVVQSDNGWIWGSEGLKHLGAGSSFFSYYLRASPRGLTDLAGLGFLTAWQLRAAGLLTHGQSLKNEHSYG